MSTNHNRIKVADLETNQPDKILTTNENGEIQFTDLNTIQQDSHNGPVKFKSVSELTQVTATTPVAVLGEDGLLQQIPISDILGLAGGNQDLQSVVEVNKTADKIELKFKTDQVLGTVSDPSAFNFLQGVTLPNGYRYALTSTRINYNGTLYSTLVRFTPDGDLDSTYTNTLVSGQNYYGQGCFLNRAKDKVYVCLYSPATYNGVAVRQIFRIKADGTLDTTFNFQSGITSPIYGVVEDSTGKVYVCGNRTGGLNGIGRFNSDGSRDTSFVSKSPNNVVLGVSVDTLDRAYITGYFITYDGVSSRNIARLLPNGNKDTSFVTGTGTNTTGPLLYPVATPDNKVIVIGNFQSFNGHTANTIIKLNNDGSRDTSFVGNAVGVTFGREEYFSGKIRLATGVNGTYNGVLGNDFVIDYDGNILSYLPPNTPTPARRFTIYGLEDKYVGLTDGGELTRANANGVFEPYKIFDFNRESTGKAEYNIKDLSITTDAEILPKFMIQALDADNLQLAKNYIDQKSPTIINNPTTIALDASYLNMNYPTAKERDLINCTAIVNGALQYQKTSTGWIQYSVTVTA